MIVGLAALALAGFAIYTRFRLSGFYQNGPTLLYCLYIGNILLSVVYFIGLNVIIPSEYLEDLDISDLLSEIIVSVIMLFVNIRYFNKRKHLFEY